MKRFAVLLIIAMAAVFLPATADGQAVKTDRGSVKTQAGQSVRLSGPLHYFGMGDSFASGEGNVTGNYDPATDVAGVNECHRSNDSYSSLIVQNTSMTGPEFVACSGAVIADILAPGQYGEAAQVDALGASANSTSPRVITVSIGGNDAFFADTLVSCLSAASCHLDAAIAGPVDTAIANMGPALEQAYTAILNHPGNGNNFTGLVVVGYPHLFGTGPCALDTFYDAGERAWMDSRADALNAVIQTVVANMAAAGERIHFADMVPVFAGHESCGSAVDTNDPSTQWINLLTSPIVHSFHPNQYGHAEMATRIQQVIYWDVLRYV